jgi:dihydroorotase-like cyclic amidohydrolase
MMYYMIRGKKIVTVSKLGTLENGAMVIEDSKIAAIGSWEKLKKQFPDMEVIDFSSFVITPSLVDCHSHLLEFAPTSLYPVTPETHFLAGKAILLQALLSGITALGEQICRRPLCDFSKEDYQKAVGTHLQPNSPEAILKFNEKTFPIQSQQISIFHPIKELHGYPFMTKP